MAQEEAQRCVKGWTKRERIILARLYEHNHLYREVGKALRRFSAPPDVSNECKDSVHIIATDRGVIALHNRVVPDEELGDVDNFFLECANAARVRQGNLDYTAAFPLKVRFTFPLLFPLGNFPTIDATEVDMDFFGRFNETQFLYHPDFQRMRSPKFGFVFQELLITTRLWLMNPAINRHKEKAMYSGNQLLSEEDFPSGTLAVRRARGDAFSIHRREGNGHFFFTATAHLDKLATILAGDRDILESWLAPKNNNVTDADIEHAQNIVHQSCEALEGKGSLDDVLYRDPVAINAAFRMKLTSIFTVLDSIRRIAFLYGSFEFQCRGLIHFHGILRFLWERGSLEHLSEELRNLSRVALDSAGIIDIEFSASRFSTDPDEQKLISRMQQHNFETGGCERKVGYGIRICRRGFPAPTAERTHYEPLPGKEG